MDNQVDDESCSEEELQVFFNIMHFEIDFLEIVSTE
jgi:hypothetical protein